MGFLRAIIAEWGDSPLDFIFDRVDIEIAVRVIDSLYTIHGQGQNYLFRFIVTPVQP